MTPSRRHVLSVAAAAAAALTLAVGATGCAGDANAAPVETLGAVDLQDSGAEGQWVSAGYRFHDEQSGAWKDAEFSFDTARNQVSGWSALDDAVIDGRLQDACSTLEAHDEDEIRDVMFLPALVNERQATGAPDVIRSLEEAKAVMRHAITAHCPAFDTVFKPEQLQPSGEPDLHLGSLSIDFLDTDVASLAAIPTFDANAAMDQVCTSLDSAKQEGEDGAAAVRALTDQIQTGAFFPGMQTAYTAEARMLQLYSVTYHCPALGSYVGDAIYPGF